MIAGCQKAFQDKALNPKNRESVIDPSDPGTFVSAYWATAAPFGVTEQLQAITISGLVVDAAGEPIIGARVVEKGTTNGGITDLDGKFTLTITQGATLKISFVGYQTQEVKAVSYTHLAVYKRQRK